MSMLRSLAVALSLAVSSPALLADNPAEPGAGVAVVREDGMRVMTAMLEAEITAIDLETREVTLRGPGGKLVTIHAQEKVAKLEDLAVGDMIEVEYLSSLEGEMRAPTEEELANPFVVLTDEAKSSDVAHPAVGAARQIRAVCTIEAADRLLGYVVVKDARGKIHTITGVEPEKFEGVTLGATVVFVYTEALAVAINHKGKQMMDDGR